MKSFNRFTVLGSLLLPTVFATSCFKEYQCIFHWLSETSTPGRPSADRQEYSFDLRPLCGSADRNYTFYTVEGYLWTIMYTICGNTSFACNPNWPHSFSRGVTIQMWGDAPGTTTTDPETGLTVDTTPPCEILGHTIPEFDVLDPNNPSQGIIMHHSSLPPMQGDQFGCPTDSRTGYPKERELDIVLQCDPTMANDDIREISFVEVKPPGSSIGTCQYRFTLASGAGCGVAGDPYDRSSNPVTSTGSGSPANNFGYTILGACLFVGVQLFYTRFYLTGKLSNLSGGRLGGSTPGKNNGFFPVSQSGSTGSTSSYGSGSYGST